MGFWGIVMEGEAYSTRESEENGETIHTKSYSEGGFFGELALFYNMPRAANVYAKTNLRVATIERKSFKRLFGGLKEKMIK